MKPALLFLTQRIPYPPIKGEKIRPLQMLRHFTQTHDVHLGTLVDDPQDMMHVPTVAAMCSSSHFAPINRRRAKITCLRGLLTGEPLSVTFYHDRDLARWVRRVLTDVKPAAIVVCSSNMAPYVLDLKAPDALCVVDLADVDSEKWRAYAAEGSGPMGWVHRREWHRVAALEARIARDCSWSTFVSEEEAALFRSQHPAAGARIRAISNGVDSVYFDPALPTTAPYDTARPNYVFTGTMDYPPNIGAVTWFANSILPLIQQRSPGAQFHIVGSSPAAAVTALGTQPGVFVTGRVPDVRPYVAHATAAVAPMRIARGIQNKVLEAMAMARTVVLTNDALEGIRAAPGEEIMVADTDSAFAAACLAPPNPAMGEAARRRVLTDYAWPPQLAGFDALLTA